MRFANIELRIGNEDHSDSGPVRLSGNPVVAFYEGGIIERRAVFQLSRPATGRYLTLQMDESDTNILDASEIFVSL